MLTTKQKMVLEAIEWFISDKGYSPTYREIADMLQSDVRTVFEKALILEEKGYIATDNGRARTIKVLKGVDDE